MTRSIAELTTDEVASALSDVPVVILPFGSIEQHGPHLPCGTDTFAAELIADALARRTGGLVAPFCDYGITPLHARYPGSVSLRRSTFESLLTDVCRALVSMGAATLVFVNWHEGNTASLDAVANEVQLEGDARCYVAQACYVAQRLYAASGGELTHGGGIETLAVMAHDPGLVRLDRGGHSNLPERARAADAMRRSREVYGFVTDVSEIAPEGWYGDPSWATSERAGDFAELVGGDIAERLSEIGAL